MGFFGGSFATNPFGEVIAQVSKGENDILIVKIDLNSVKKFCAQKLFFRDRKSEIYPLD